MKLQVQIMNKIFILTGLIIALMVLPYNVTGQTVVKIDHYMNCSDTEVLIPVELENFEDVAAFTLYIGVNTDNIEYIDVESVNEVFATGNLIGGVNLEEQTIILTWASFTPANLDEGVICNIRVLFKNNPANFSFLDNCEIISSDLSIIENVEYFDGSLVTLSSITIDPVVQTVTEGEPATIGLIDLAEGISCQWQILENENWINLENMSPYSGVHTAQLLIQPVSANLNASLFRCMLSSGTCSESSMESELLVIPVGFEELDGKGEITPLNIYPNPVEEYLNCIINSNIPDAELRLINTSGVMLIIQQLGDVDSGEMLALNLSNVKSGIYFLQLISKDNVITTLKVLRK